MVFAAILAGGSGSRMNAGLPKQFLDLNGKPVISHTIKAFDDCKEIDSLIIVIPPDFFSMMDEILQNHPPVKPCKIIAGGTTRRDSSRNAVNACAAQNHDIILLHDAARPFVSQQIINASIKTARNHGACGVYTPAVDTITEIIDEKITAIPSRDHLYYTQTPQTFRYDIIRKAHNLPSNTQITDDVSLVLESGGDVYMVEGDYSNIKITTPFDMEIAQLIVSAAD